MAAAKPKLSCPKCAGSMEEGYVGRPWATYAGQPEHWAPGRPAAVADFGIGPKKKSVRTVVSWRCRQCGFLESYAG